VATSVKELGLVDTEGDRGLAKALVAGGAARGLGDDGGARGPWAGRGLVAPSRDMNKNLLLP
jgi:hypothetical protein